MLLRQMYAVKAKVGHGMPQTNGNPEHRQSQHNQHGSLLVARQLSPGLPHPAGPGRRALLG